MIHSASDASSKSLSQTDLGLDGKNAMIKHIWIIERVSSRLVFYHDFEGSFHLDGVLLSGLLSALQSFSEFELHEHGIENIDMGGLRWIYSSFAESNLMIVVAGPKSINPALTLSRVKIIHKMFIQEYDIDHRFFKTWDSLITPFKNFSETLKLLHHQWAKAQRNMDVGRLFDMLRIFQEIFIKFMQVIETSVPRQNHHQLLVEISKALKDLDKSSPQYTNSEFSDSDRIIALFLPQVNLEMDTITFSRTSAMKILGLNPNGFDEDRLYRIFLPVFRSYKAIIQQYIGEIAWNGAVKEHFSPYILDNWTFLQNLKILRILGSLFWQ